MTKVLAITMANIRPPNSFLTDGNEEVKGVEAKSIISDFIVLIPLNTVILGRHIG